MNVKLLLLPLLVWFLTGCSAAQPPLESTPPPDEAMQTSQHDEIYSRLIEERNIVILGEMHGNSNSPETALQLAQDILARHGFVALGLEMPIQEQPRLDEFLSSGGNDQDIQALLASEFWSERFIDGRSSLALLDLLQQLRQLKAAGNKLQVHAIDGFTGAPGQQDPEEEMARPIIDWATANPQRSMVVLVGNMHAQLQPIQIQEFTIIPMARLVQQSVDDVISINLVYHGGETMALTDTGFAPLRLAPQTPPRPGLRPFSGPEPTFDFEWELGPALPSMPAILGQ